MLFAVNWVFWEEGEFIESSKSGFHEWELNDVMVEIVEHCRQKRFQSD